MDILMKELRDSPAMQRVLPNRRTQRGTHTHRSIYIEIFMSIYVCMHFVFILSKMGRTAVGCNHLSQRLNSSAKERTK